jgi:Activator of Hsp90 ATPase homolog 1-like protein
MNKAPSSQISPDQDAIVGEVEIAAPPEQVFRALTDPAQLIRWWGDDICKTSVWEMDARHGGKWRFEASDPSGKIVVNGVSAFTAYGEITEFDPPRLLAYTWLGTGTIIPNGRPRRAGSCRQPRPAPGSRSLTAVSPTNRLPARTMRVAGRDCSNCSENTANKKRGNGSWLPVQLLPTTMRSWRKFS